MVGSRAQGPPVPPTPRRQFSEALQWAYGWKHFPDVSGGWGVVRGGECTAGTFYLHTLAGEVG